MKFRLSDLNADTIKKGFAHIRSTAIPEALSKGTFDGDGAGSGV